MIMSVMLSASGVPATLPPATTCAEAVGKQAEIIGAMQEEADLLSEKIARLEAAISEHKKAEVSLAAEVDAQVKIAETYKKLWQAEMEFTAAERKRTWWSERFVALKWLGIGAAGGVLAMEVAK